MRIIQVILLGGLVALLSACANKNSLGNMNRGTGGSSVIDPNPFGRGLDGGAELSSECPTNLLGLVTLESPTSLPIPVNTTVTFKIQAVGCSGKYSLQENPSQIFTNSTTVQRTYNSAGEKQETFIINSVDANNTRILRTLPKPINITVVASGGGANPNPPQGGGGPLMCNVLRASAVTARGQAVKFTLSVVGGTAATAVITDGLAVSANALNNAQVEIMPGPDGVYRAYGYVSNAAGNNFCQTQFTAPSCQIEATNVNWNSADAKLTLPSGIMEATVQGQPINAGDPTQTRVVMSKVTFGPGSITGRTLKAEAMGPAFQFGRDKVSCETQPFNLPPAPLAGAVLSWISDGESKVEINANTIRLYNGAGYSMHHFQILGIRMNLDGSVVEEVVVNVPLPFANYAAFNQWKEIGWQNIGRTRDFSEILMPDARRVGLSVHTQTFGNRETNAYFEGMGLEMRANRGTVQIDGASTSQVAVTVNDAAQYGFGYYQIALCNSSIMPCRY